MPDPVSEEVGFLGAMKEDDEPIELALRLKIRNGQITETRVGSVPVPTRNLWERR